MEKKNIILVGFMATGKTTIGKLLAKQTGMRFVDMDAIIEEREGRTINDIFATDGEPHFRKLEGALAKELAQTSGLIISTGGGIVLNPDNIAALDTTGLVACLMGKPEEIIRRVASCTARPLLAGNKEKQVRALFEQRRPLYESIPFQVMTDGLKPTEIAEKILQEFQS
ncbi:shikimate kinase [Verrucomicrobiota bacterium]